MNDMTPRFCADLIRENGRVVALTGAGISTAAGIPDFRGPQGLYVTRQYDAEKVFDINAFLRDPGPFYEFSRDFLAKVESLEPTFTHRFLTELEELDLLLCVVTQNIDFLHQKAGSKGVLSVHGDYWTSHCLACGLEIGFELLCLKVRSEAIPLCDACGGLIKPDVVFFGEAVKSMSEAAEAVNEAGLLLVLGSSLTVYPSASLPQHARCPVVVVNRGDVGLEQGPNRYFVDADLDEFFGEVSEIMGEVEDF
ncbi:MAG: Sir2 family NAD-dependent protein deacetylase [Thermoanaerobaculales bacterium]|nr:Sir2 family NAD-dependent protein deacetylase [Thermoanaerobaculales bacterium]